MNTAEFKGSRQEILKAWMGSLGAVLQKGTGINPAIRPTGPSKGVEDGSPVLWWKNSTETAPAIWIGATDSAWQSLAETLLSFGGGAIGDPNDAQNAYLGLLNQSWEARGALTDEPGCTAFEGVEVRFPDAEPVVLLVGFDGNAEFQDPAAQPGAALGVLLDIELPVTLRFGSKLMALQDVLSLNAGSVIDFNRAPDEPVEVLVNGHVVARGEAVMVQGSYGVRISEIESRRARLDTTSGPLAGNAATLQGVK